jgi:acyl-CoA thioester hydrolase
MDGQSKSDFIYYFPITTRWMDNDMFGHVNNVNYYSYFDTIINQFLIEQADFVPQQSEQIGFIVKSSCSYISSLSYPQKLVGALRVARIGKSSVDYEVGIFKENEDLASAVGTLTHVFVDRDSHQPTPIKGLMHKAMLLAMLPS